MSTWTYIRGYIKVYPLGRTSHEKRYILETVLDHLPRVTGSEGDIHIIVNAFEPFRYRHDDFNEFDQCVGRHNHHRNNIEEEYFLVITGDLRDRVYSQTFKELNKFLIRLAKRVRVEDVMIKLFDDFGHKYIFDSDKYSEIIENTSWVSEGKETNWCEYLMNI